MYCLPPTLSLLADLRNFQLGLGGTAPSTIQGQCACNGFKAGTFYMDVVAGCDPRLPRQTKPPVCFPCPPGKGCLDPFNVINCPIGTYSAFDLSGCTPCETFACPPGFFRPKGQCSTPNLADTTGQRMWDRWASSPPSTHTHTAPPETTHTHTHTTGAPPARRAWTERSTPSTTL